MSTLHALPPFLTNYLLWLGLAALLFLVSFIQTNGDTARVIAGVLTAIGALLFFLL
jgi:hypothetical protein